VGPAAFRRTQLRKQVTFGERDLRFSFSSAVKLIQALPVLGVQLLESLGGFGQHVRLDGVLELAALVRR